MDKQIPGIGWSKVRVPAWGVALALIMLLGVLCMPRHRKVSDSDACILNQRNIQQAVRAYASFHELKVGDAIGWSKIVGFGQFIEKIPECPVHGINAYTYSQTIPEIGVLVVPCKDPAHRPPSTEGW